MSALSSAPPLRAFLRGALAARPPAVHSITLCIGNEAADADSIISSVCLAWIRSQQQPYLGVAVVPVVSVSRKELALRRETELLLREVGLEFSDLICLDEVLSAEGVKTAVKSLILVDHNFLSARVAKEFPSASVDEILDHHQDANKYPSIPASKRIIAFDSGANEATAASTCTLVAQQYLASPPSSDSMLDASISTLLLGVIAIDSHNGNPAMGRAYPPDLEAMNNLQPRSGVLDRDALYSKLSSAKLDVDFWRGLSMEQCLVLDYKQQPIPTFCHGPDVGVSSVMQPVTEMLARPDAVPGFLLYMEQQSLDMLGVMSFVLTPEPARELLLVARSPQRALQAHTFFTSPSSADLALAELPLRGEIKEAAQKSGLHLWHYSQGNVKASRKQVLPLVKKFYESIIEEIVSEEGCGDSRSV